MTITINPIVEQRIRERAEAEGLSVTAYIERLVDSDQSGEEDLEGFALGALHSSEPIEVGPGYWEERHRQLDERLKKSGAQGVKAAVTPPRLAVNVPIHIHIS